MMTSTKQTFNYEDDKTEVEENEAEEGRKEDVGINYTDDGKNDES